MLFVILSNYLFASTARGNWLAQWIPKLAKTGIVYTGTQTNTEIFSNWLQFLGLNSAAYSGRLDPESRKRVEETFMANGYDCVVSTNALGMGIDKPDIRFIVHTQVTQSPIHYYQEVGRAGRDGQTAYAILLYNPNADQELPRAFIEGSKPGVVKYEQVMAVTKKALLGQHEIIKASNLKQNQVVVILADLVEQGILNEQVKSVHKKYFYNTDAPLLDLSGFEKLRNAQYEELDNMLAYIDFRSCRMQYLCNYLGDETDIECGICDNDRKKYFRLLALNGLADKLTEFRETFFPILEVEKLPSKIINGVAASYYGISNVGAALRHSKYEGGGDFPDWLLVLTLKAFRKQFGNTVFDLILFVPSTESGDLVKNFAEKISSVLKFPVSDCLLKREPTLPQKELVSGISKKDNVKGKFVCQNPDEIAGKRILLVDDIFDSGYTMKEIGIYLTGLGAEMIAPITIARTVGGDI